jgi:hypothetical protein
MPPNSRLCMDRNELYVKYATMGMENLVLAGRFAQTLRIVTPAKGSVW